MPTDIDLLQDLRDVIPPPEPGFWPPAIGWWLVTILILILIAAIIYSIKLAIVRYSRHSIVQQIDEIAGLQPPQAIAELSILMRRVAITRFPRSAVAGLTGQAWLEFLDQSGNTDQFTQGVGRMLTIAPYSANKQFDLDSLREICREWVKTVLPAK